MNKSIVNTYLVTLSILELGITVILVLLLFQIKSNDRFIYGLSTDNNQYQYQNTYVFIDNMPTRRNSRQPTSYPTLTYISQTPTSTLQTPTSTLQTNTPTSKPENGSDTVIPILRKPGQEDNTGKIVGITLGIFILIFIIAFVMEKYAFFGGAKNRYFQFRPKSVGSLEHFSCCESIMMRSKSCLVFLFSTFFMCLRYFFIRLYEIYKKKNQPKTADIDDVKNMGGHNAFAVLQRPHTNTTNLSDYNKPNLSGSNARKPSIFNKPYKPTYESDIQNSQTQQIENMDSTPQVVISSNMNRKIFELSKKLQTITNFFYQNKNPVFVSEFQQISKKSTGEFVILKATEPKSTTIETVNKHLSHVKENSSLEEKNES
jgi:hypothetical protein